MSSIEVNLTADFRVVSDDPRISNNVQELRPQTDMDVREKMKELLSEIRDFRHIPENLVDELQAEYEKHPIEVFHFYTDSLKKSRDQSLPKNERPKLSNDQVQFFKQELTMLEPCVDSAIAISIGYLGALRQVYATESRETQDPNHRAIIQEIIKVIEKRKLRKESEIRAGDAPCQPVAASMRMAHSADKRWHTKKHP
jgi:hypothetical protein